MNKSVYILDTPTNCKECPINKCSAWVDADHRPDECPLRRLPMPEPENYYDFQTFTSGVAHGHNRFYERITGEKL